MSAFAKTLQIKSCSCFRHSSTKSHRPPRTSVQTEGFSYTVTGAIENVYPALVVLLGYTNTFTRTNNWQHQAQYEMSPGELCGFRQIQEREGQLELGLYFGATCPPYTQTLFQGLFERFLRRRDITVVKYPPVSCDECGYRQQRSEVVKRIHSNKAFLHCGECGHRIELLQFAEEVKLSRRDQERVERERTLAERRTSFEAALVHVKSVHSRPWGRLCGATLFRKLCQKPSGA